MTNLKIPAATTVSEAVRQTIEKLPKSAVFTVPQIDLVVAEMKLKKQAQREKMVGRVLREMTAAGVLELAGKRGKLHQYRRA
jgi:hypothetical protein